MTTPLLPLSPPTPIPDSIKKKRVLLVDTSQAKRELRAEIMRKLGIDVDCAADINEALSWCRADLYNLVLINAQNEVGQRDDFCEFIRKATPPQELAFLVGKPEYLAGAPKTDGESSVQSNGEQVQAADVSPVPPVAGSDLPERWGILEASRRISAVRSASVACTLAMQDRPAPPRDSQRRLSKQTPVAASLADLRADEG
jgi:CheY-like chemotaxis protein